MYYGDTYVLTPELCKRILTTVIHQYHIDDVLFHESMFQRFFHFCSGQTKVGEMPFRYEIVQVSERQEWRSIQGQTMFLLRRFPVVNGDRFLRLRNDMSCRLFRIVLSSYRRAICQEDW